MTREETENSTQTNLKVQHRETYSLIQPRLIVGFAGTYLAGICCGDWVVSPVTPPTDETGYEHVILTLHDVY